MATTVLNRENLWQRNKTIGLILLHLKIIIIFSEVHLIIVKSEKTLREISYFHFFVGG